jgi:hypothetical protein
VAGVVGGFPAEIDATSKVRYVAPLLVNMSERSADLLKYVGGPESFDFRNTKVEWQEDDVWSRRLSHTGLVGGATVALVVTGAAHRYPIGTILYLPSDNEYMRVTGHTDADTLVIARDIYTTATGGAGAVASTAEILVSGFTMDENDDYVFRPTAIFGFPYNHPQVHQAGVKASFRRQETALYNMRGNDLDYRALDLIAEQFVAMEQSLVHGYRFAGTASVPAAMGGLKFYVTSANGATVTDLASAALTRKDIDDMLQTIWYSVGGDKMGKTLLVSAWAKRKISSFFSAAERLGPGTQAGGVVIDRLNTDFGVIDLMLHTALAKNELFLINQSSMKMGCHGQRGRPHLEELPPSNVGPRSEKVFYGDLSVIVSGVQAMGRIHTFSVTA